MSGGASGVIGRPALIRIEGIVSSSRPKPDHLLFFVVLNGLLGFFAVLLGWNFTEHLPEMADQVLVIGIFAVG